MMKGFFAALTLLSFVTFSLTSNADEGLIKPIKLGEIAPFEGLLLSPSAVAEIVSDKKTEPGRILIAVESERKRSEADCQLRLGNDRLKHDSQVTLLGAEIKMKDSRLTALSEELKISQENEGRIPYYVGGGVLAGTLLTILTTFAITHISN